MVKFNKGDKVVCVSVTPGLRKGKHYEVVDTVDNTTSNMVAIIDETGDKYFYSSRQFITTEQQKENLRLMLISKVKLKLDSFYW
jgi:GMP synthase PP-ATPase subunit